MMRKLYKLILLLTIILTLTACTGIIEKVKFEGVTDDIIKPSNRNLMIKGTWKLKDKVVPENIENDILEKYSDTEWYYLTDEIVKFESRYTEKPNFKTRYLNFSEFIKDLSKETKETEKYIKGEGTVFTVTDGQYFYQDIFVINDNEIAFVYDGILFVFEKVSSDVSKEIITNVKELIIEKNSDDDTVVDKKNDIALLLGIKTPRKDKNGNSYYTYRTVLFRRNNKHKPLIYSIKNLLIPRATGFWMVGQEHIIDDRGTRDVLFSYSLAVGNKESSRYLLGEKNNNSIIYLGKDHVALEIYDYISSERTYGIYDLNRLSDNTRLSILDIAGELGVQTFKDETAKILSASTIEEDLVDDLDITNIGIKRTNDRWNFVSNINMRVNNNLQTREFRISLIPTIDLIDQDSLSVPWDAIRTKLPGAIDAYTSPDKSVLVVQNNNELLAFDLNDGIISNESLLSAKINENDRIVMAQWIMGEQASVWEETVKNQEIIPMNFIIPH